MKLFRPPRHYAILSDDYDSYKEVGLGSKIIYFIVYVILFVICVLLYMAAS